MFLRDTRKKKKKKKTDIIGRVTVHANARDHHVRSTVDQMGYLGSYEHFGCNGQGLHRVGIPLSVVSMQKSIRLPKVVTNLAAKRASSSVRL